MDSFEIVLADGSVQNIMKPTEGGTSEFNDDMYYAVLGGASGSWGVITEVTFNSIDENQYHTFYWEVNYYYNDDTKEDVAKMLQEYVKLPIDDNRWSMVWSFLGGKTLFDAFFFENGLGPDKGFNLVTLDFAWVSKKSESSQEDALAEATNMFEKVTNACARCEINLSYFPPNTKGLIGPASKLHHDHTVHDFRQTGLVGLPYSASFQQGPKYPDRKSVVKILRLMDDLMPMNGLKGNEHVFVLAQFDSTPTKGFKDNKKALPFQGDVFGLHLDVFDLSPYFNPSNTGVDIPSYKKIQRRIQDLVISATGNVDHRMFWAAYEDPTLHCGGDWEKYYESQEKFKELILIKSCVDPGNMFKNSMSVPLRFHNNKKCEIK